VSRRLQVHGDRPDPEIVGRALDALRVGALLIYPTDTLYALGGRALDPAAGRLVRAAKGREEGKPLPLIAADLEQARGLCARWPAAAGRLARRFWPGPLTLVLPASGEVPWEVCAGTGSVAVRVPGLLLARRLCSAGALVATSANRAGEPAPLTCGEALASVGGAAALALDAGPGRPAPSTLVDVSGPEPRLLRAGAVPWAEIEALLRGGDA
jgi:L-threonylcarbamoyladenylate synthase